VKHARRLAAHISLALLASLASLAAYAENCDKDSLSDKSNDGDILMTLSGHVYRVLPGDEIDSALWLPPSEVLVCHKSLMVKGKPVSFVEIINLDEHGEKVGATLLK
jgi:hypothetical protein